MPTGYTDFLSKKTDATLSEFAWRCARAMGFCITQRDDSSDAPVNMHDVPSIYYEEALGESTAELSRVESMSDLDWDEESKRTIAETVERERDFDDKARKTLASYQRMLGLVNKWHPPEELRAIKSFMVEQLTTSIEFDAVIGDKHPEWRVHNPVPRSDQIKLLEKQVADRQKRWDEEVNRVAERNRYKRLLLESVGEPSCAIPVAS